MNRKSWIEFKAKWFKLPASKRSLITLGQGVVIVFDRNTRSYSARRVFSTIEKSIKKVFNFSIDKIDSIHKSHFDFLSILVQESNDPYFRGALLYDEKTGVPYCLEISRHNGEKPITIFHEIGHLIDLMAVGIPGHLESKVSEGVFSKLLECAKNTTEISKIESALSSGKIEISGIQLPLPPRTRSTLEYLLQPHEIVARSYAQYIVEKTKSRKLNRMLDTRRNNSKFGEQWSTEQFAPLLVEWDNILNSIRWHVKK
jgi:hypothetical protein